MDLKDMPELQDMSTVREMYKNKWISAKPQGADGGYRGAYCIDDGDPEEMGFKAGPHQWRVVDEVFDQAVAARTNAFEAACEEIDAGS